MEGIHEADALGPAETATDCGRAPADALAESGRRVVEQRLYRALVDHAYGTARGPTAQDAWAEAVPELRVSWEILKEKYGHEERAEPAPQADGGSWRGKGGRALDAARNAEIDLGYARIREVGENVIVPAILRVAAEDPTRTLAGFDRRIKGEDRLKEKISDRMRSKGRSAAEALAQISDVVRFTFTYSETSYTPVACARTWNDSKSPGSPRSNGATPGHPTSTRESTRNGVEPQLRGTLRGAVSHAGQS